MFKNLSKSLTILLACLLPGSVLALTLGEEVVLSNLGEPVRVEIEIVPSDEVALDRLSISLAPEDSFKAFGIDYLPFLANLQFSIPEAVNDTELKLVISSNEALQEPYMEMLLLLSWPGGSLLREYVLLFDFPEASSAESVVEPESRPEPEAEQISQVEDKVDAEPQPLIRAKRLRYRVQAGDTLWSIARQFHTSETGYSIYQTLLGLHDLNRNSFINENISLLKTNQELLIPTVDDLGTISFGTARAMYNERWESGIARYDAVQRGEAVEIFSSIAPAGDFAAEDTTSIAESFERIPEPKTQPAKELPQAVNENSLILASTSSSIEMAAGSFGTVDEQAAAAAEEALLERVSLAAISIQELMKTRELQLRQLETEVADMRQKLQETQAVTDGLTGSLAVAVAKRESQEEAKKKETLTFIVIDFALILVLLAAVVTILRISAQLRKETAASTSSIDREPVLGSILAESAENEPVEEGELAESIQEEMFVETMPYGEVNQEFEAFEDYSFDNGAVLSDEIEEFEETEELEELEEFEEPEEELEGSEGALITDGFDYLSTDLEVEDQIDVDENESIPFYVEPVEEFDDREKG